MQVSDKAYATDFINKLAEQIKSKQTDFQMGIDKELADSKIGQSALPTVVQSGTFNKVGGPFPTPADQIFTDPAVKSKIATLNKGDISDPFLVKIATSTDPAKPQLVDGYWLLVKIDDNTKYKNNNYSDFNSAINVYKKKLGYAVYK